MTELPEEATIKLPPDWACEILSERTETRDRGRKMRIWRREGVGYVWLASPERRTLEVYRLENGRYSLLDTWEGEEIVRAEPFDAIELPLRVFWNM